MVTKIQRGQGVTAENGKRSLRERYKALRKLILCYTPFVRRSRHERVLARTEWHWNNSVERERKLRLEMASFFLSPPPLAHAAACAIPVPIKGTSVDELCLFVTHAANATLKPHVIDHVNALLGAGVEVLLVANADVGFSQLDLPAALAGRLYGCLIRENVGYDFAAWAHAYSLIDPGLIRRRLYLINDSIVGPLDLAAYRALLQRIRESQADAIGLTSNPDPHPHLQSYYLVFNERVLRSATYQSLMNRIQILPSKQHVIDAYEIWLSPCLERAGFVSAALFPNLTKRPPPNRNDTFFAWRQLFDLGFPFIKSLVLRDSDEKLAELRDPDDANQARRLVPERYLDSMKEGSAAR